MKDVSLRKSSRLLLLLCGIALIVVLFVPLWHIDLTAPQYPEGLQLVINAHGLGGNVTIVNGLNHYIGMKALHTEDFFEFTLLPFIIGFFALALFIVALVGQKKYLNALFTLFAGFGIIAMVDFWRWEYDYGHHLNADAPIIVPGMAYQPPLIGFKQLLNFGAWSMPGPGGWLFVGVGAALLLLVVLEWKTGKRRIVGFKPFTLLTVVPMLFFACACTPGPRPFAIGSDHCDFCQMTITDRRFGAEIVTKKGRVYKFDDTHCILTFLREKTTDRAQVKDIYFIDFCNNHPFIAAGTAFFLRSDALRSPMEGNVAAFGNKDSLDKVAAEYKGIMVGWNELYH